MGRSQLAINCPAPLLQRLRTEAQRQEVTATALVLQWIEAGLDGELGRPSPPPRSDLEARLDALEQRLDALPASPIRGMPPSPKPVTLPSPALVGAGRPDGAITTAELAERTGTNRAAWNNWAAKATAGDVRHHPDAGSWRLMGKAPAEVGGPARWLWEQCLDNI
jgi:hypothetical protein